ncbi:hypothetical protein Tco_0257007 [Tanacetum coccineum]
MIHLFMRLNHRLYPETPIIPSSSGYDSIHLDQPIPHGSTVTLSSLMGIHQRAHYDFPFRMLHLILLRDTYSLSPVRADLIPSPKRVKDSGYLADVEAEIDECNAYADALRDRGIDARVIVEAVDRDETETGVRGPVEVGVERVTHPAMPEDIPEPAQEVLSSRTIEGVQRKQGHRMVGVESAVIALTERIAELERDNIRLRGTASVERNDTGGRENGGNGNRNGNHGMNYGGFMPVARDQTPRMLLRIATPIVWQPPYKRQNTSGQNVARAYTAGNNERRGYVGPLPYCNKCRLHHEGLCTMRCGNYKKVGHQTRECRTAIAPTSEGSIGNQQLRLDRLTPLVEEEQTLISTLSRSSFDIDSKSCRLGSFDVIFGMDWLGEIHALIVCDEIGVRITYEMRVLIIRGDNCDSGSGFPVLGQFEVLGVTLMAVGHNYRQWYLQSTLHDVDTEHPKFLIGCLFLLQVQELYVSLSHADPNIFAKAILTRGGTTLSEVHVLKNTLFIPVSKSQKSVQNLLSLIEK